MTHRFRLYQLYLNFVVCVQDEPVHERDPVAGGGRKGGGKGGGKKRGGGTGEGRKGGGYVISMLPVCNAYAN